MPKIDSALPSVMRNPMEWYIHRFQNQGYVFPSTTPLSGLPKVGFAVGDTIFYVPQESLLFSETEPGWVYGGIQSRGDMTFDILGDTFLQNVVVDFDIGAAQMRFVSRPFY